MPKSKKTKKLTSKPVKKSSKKVKIIAVGAVIIFLFVFLLTAPSSQMRKLRKIEDFMGFPGSSINMRIENDRGEYNEKNNVKHRREIFIRVFGPEYIHTAQDKLNDSDEWSVIDDYGGGNYTSQELGACIFGVYTEGDDDQDATITIADKEDDECSRFFREK